MCLADKSVRMSFYLKPKSAERFVDTFFSLLGESLFQAIMDLFFAGTETTSTSLTWAFLFFIKHPDIQDKCRQEILKVLR